jgi:hypothetical protein
MKFIFSPYLKNWNFISYVIINVLKPRNNQKVVAGFKFSDTFSIFDTLTLGYFDTWLL